MATNTQTNPDLWGDWAVADPNAASSWADYWWGNFGQEAQAESWGDWAVNDPNGAATSWADYYWDPINWEGTQSEQDVWYGWAESDPDSASSWADHYWGDFGPGAQEQGWYDWAAEDPESASSWADFYWDANSPPQEEIEIPGDQDTTTSHEPPPSITGGVPEIPSDQAVLSTSGIDWGQSPGSDILPSLIDTALGLPGLAAESGDVLQGYYDLLMRNALGPDAFQGTLNDLASRNMLQSSVAGDALAKTAQPIMEGIGEQAYRSELDRINLEMQVPGLLGGVAQLGDTGVEYGDPLDAAELLFQTLGYI